MTKSIAERMFIKEGHVLAILNPPEGFLGNIGSMPENVEVLDHLGSGNLDIACAFITKQAVMADTLKKLKNAIKPEGYIWISYPKKSSKMGSDLSRDIIWKFGQEIGLKSVHMISLDDTWSSMRMRIDE